jgi:hypothetical protein
MAHASAAGGVRQSRQHFGHGCVQLKLALLHQLQDGGGGELLGQ